MKKVISLVLTVCLLVWMMAPTLALADNATDLANSAKRVIELYEEQVVTEYAYSNVLGLLLLALTANNYELNQSYLTVFNGMASVESYDSLSSISNMISGSNERHRERCKAILQDAIKCYEKNEYSFDILEKYVNFLLIEEAP